MIDLSRRIGLSFHEHALSLGCVYGFVNHHLDEVSVTQVRALFKSIGAVAPAMGMIGILISLVQMLGNLDDSAILGPAMAIALLTTLYGALMAHAFALPIADKLGYAADTPSVLELASEP